MGGDISNGASETLIQNLILLCRDLRLPVAYKVLEASKSGGKAASGGNKAASGGDKAASGGDKAAPSGDKAASGGDEAAPGGNKAAPGGDEATSGASAPRTFFVIVHVHADHAFKGYLKHCSQSDLMLFRGLVLKVCMHEGKLLSAQVQQAFLPKFENEVQDSRIADAIVAGAHERFMVVTIKHSGSLVTLSGSQGFAAKNSLDNEFTAGATALLSAHFQRVCGGDKAAADARLAALMTTLTERNVTVSFEMVTGCHGHHGQLPAGEYLVATSAHTLQPLTGRPAFLAWPEFMRLCVELGLPVNDTWLFAGHSWAAAARDSLDALAVRGGPTARALAALSAAANEGAADGCLHLPGTYPHDAWQGSRIEGFVVAQGQPVDGESLELLRQMRPALERSRIELKSVPEALQRPYQAMLEQPNASAATVQAAVRDACSSWYPGWTFRRVEGNEKATVVEALAGRAPAAGPKLVLPGETLYARAALADAKPRDLLALLQEAVAAEQEQQQQWPAQRAQALAALSSQLADMVQNGGEGAEDKDMLVDKARDTGEGAEEKDMPEDIARDAGEGVADKDVPKDMARDGGKGVADKNVPEDMARDGGEGVADKNVPAKKARNDGKDVLAARNSLLRALSGAPEPKLTLRYKKKMMLWTMPPPPAPQQQQQPPARDADLGVIGYCMMTFVIRNGLKALSLGRSTYHNYVTNLARTWGLPQDKQAQVHLFARAWASWIDARGGAGSVNGMTYLDAAEPFADAFLAARGQLCDADDGKGGRRRPDGAFQGILVMLETSRELAEATQASLHATHFLEPNEIPPYSKGLVSQGTVLWLPPSNPPPRPLREFAVRASSHLFLAVQGVPTLSNVRDEPDAKRHKGMHASKRRILNEAMGDAAESRTKVLDECSSPEEQAQALAVWLGGGAPVPPQDPAVIACCITIPGCGKTAIFEGLQDAVAAEGSGGDGGGGCAPSVVKVLNSDKMKKALKQFSPKNYWTSVADAAETHVGGGSATLVVADKNLVPHPHGHLQRVLNVLAESGATTLALLPLASRPSSVDSMPHLYVGLPKLPMPLEMVALCMLRVLMREQHEGDLDAARSESAASVVAMFAVFYRNTSLSQLRDRLESLFGSVCGVPIMEGIGSAGAPPMLEEVLQHVAKGLATCSVREEPPLPLEWEARARELLARDDVRHAVLSLQRPLPHIQADVAAALARLLRATRMPSQLHGSMSLSTALQEQMCTSEDRMARADAAGGRAAPLRWLAIAALPKDQLLEGLLGALDGRLPDELVERIRKGRPEYHVTLWHCDDPVMGKDTVVRDALAACVGQPAHLQVSALVADEEVAAAQVVLLSGPDAVVAQGTQKAFRHITLAVASGVHAKMANLLPERLAKGKAMSYTLPEPFYLEGQVLGCTDG